MQSVRIRTVARRALGALLASAIALAATTQVAAAAETQDKAQLQQQLDAARGRLDDAARDVADLSRKLYGDDFEGMPMPSAGGPPRGAMLGINIGGGPDLAEGVEVMGVSPSGPAAAAGLKTGDVIVAIDGKPLRKTGDRAAGRQFVEQMRGTQPGQKVKVDYLRDGKKLSTTVTTVAAEPPMVRMLREHIPMLEGMQIPPDWEEMINPRCPRFPLARTGADHAQAWPVLRHRQWPARGQGAARAGPRTGGGRRDSLDRRTHAGQSAARLPYPRVVPARGEGQGRSAAPAQAPDSRPPGAGGRSHEAGLPAWSAPARAGASCAAGRRERRQHLVLRLPQ